MNEQTLTVGTKRGPILDRLPFGAGYTVLFLLVSLLVGAGIVVFLKDDSEPWRTTHTYWALSAGSLLFSLISWYGWKSKGTWHLGKEGVEFVPLIDDPLFLRWDEIDAVSYGKDIGLAQGKKKMSIMLSCLEKEERESVKQLVQQHLGEHFDLTDYESEQYKKKASLQNIARSLLIPLIAGAVFKFGKHHFGAILAMLIVVGLSSLQSSLSRVPTWRRRGVFYGKQKKSPSPPSETL